MLSLLSKKPQSLALCVSFLSLITATASNDETLPLLYTLPTLYFASADVMHAFKISSETTRAMWPRIRYVVLMIKYADSYTGIDLDLLVDDEEEWAHAVDLLKSMEGLRELKIVVDRACKIPPGRKEMQMLEGVNVHRQGRFEIAIIGGPTDELRQMQEEGSVRWKVVNGWWRDWLTEDYYEVRNAYS